MLSSSGRSLEVVSDPYSQRVLPCIEAAIARACAFVIGAGELCPQRNVLGDRVFGTAAEADAVEIGPPGWLQSRESGPRPANPAAKQDTLRDLVTAARGEPVRMARVDRDAIPAAADRSVPTIEREAPFQPYDRSGEPPDRRVRPHLEPAAEIRQVKIVGSQIPGPHAYVVGLTAAPDAGAEATNARLGSGWMLHRKEEHGGERIGSARVIAEGELHAHTSLDALSELHDPVDSVGGAFKHPAGPRICPTVPFLVSDVFRPGA